MFAVYRSSGATPFVAGRRFGPLLARLSAASGARVLAAARNERAHRKLELIGQETIGGLRARRERHAAYGGDLNRTHVGRNDGVLYRRPAGWPIPWYSTGFDLEPSEVSAMRAAAHEEGYLLITGPGRRWQVHANLVRPRRRVTEVAGQRSRRIGRLSAKLCEMGYLDAPSRWFDETVADGVRHFQDDAGLPGTGDLDPATSAQLTYLHRLRRGS